jgi:hypothetical protein
MPPRSAGFGKWQDWIAPAAGFHRIGGRIIVHRECAGGQQNGATSILSNGHNSTFSAPSFTRTVKSYPLPKAEVSPKGEVTDFIAVVFAFIFFCGFLPKNRMSSPKTT